MAEVLVKQVQKRVLRLEDLMAQLLVTADRTERNLDRLSAEMRDFKDEMRDFKDEMRDFKDEMRVSRERSEQSMNKFQQEMQVLREERRQDERNFRKEMGELSRKMGTMVEDMVVPSISRILHQTIGCPRDGIEFQAVRVKKLHPVTRQHQEYDVVVVCGDYLFVNETKSSLKPKDVKEFAEDVLPCVREFFPEYAGKKVIGAIGSLYVDDSLVRYGERLGLIVLGFGEDVMDVLNQPGFVPKCF